MSETKTLIQKIKTLAEQKPNVTVAISGFGGAGKSYLTQKLQAYFSIQDQQTICIDNLYGPNPNGPDIFDQTDWQLLDSILKDVKQSKALNYVGKSFEGEAIPIKAILPKVLIVEGIRLLQPRFMPYFDISVWIDCPHSLALARAKQRDAVQGETVENIRRWDTDWGPKDALYFERYQPKKLASVIFTDYQ